MDRREKSALRLNHKKLVDEIPMGRDILDRLYSDKVFTSAMIEDIESNSTDGGRINRMLRLLPKRGPEAFGKFLTILDDISPWLAEILKDGLTKPYSSYSRKARSRDHNTMKDACCSPIPQTDRVDISCQETSVKSTDETDGLLYPHTKQINPSLHQRYVNDTKDVPIPKNDSTCSLCLSRLFSDSSASNDEVFSNDCITADNNDNSTDIYSNDDDEDNNDCNHDICDSDDDHDNDDINIGSLTNDSEMLITTSSLTFEFKAVCPGDENSKIKEDLVMKKDFTAYKRRVQSDPVCMCPKPRRDVEAYTDLALVKAYKTLQEEYERVKIERDSLQDRCENLEETQKRSVHDKDHLQNYYSRMEDDFNDELEDLQEKVEQQEETIIKLKEQNIGLEQKIKDQAGLLERMTIDNCKFSFDVKYFKRQSEVTQSLKESLEKKYYEDKRLIEGLKEEVQKARQKDELIEELQTKLKHFEAKESKTKGTKRISVSPQRRIMNSVTGRPIGVARLGYIRQGSRYK